MRRLAVLVLLALCTLGVVAADDIAPTAARLLEVPAPAVEGRVLAEILE